MKAFFFLALIILPLIFACTYPEAEYIPYIPAPDTVIIHDTVIIEEPVDNIFDDYDPYFRYQGYLNYAGQYGFPNYTRAGTIDILPAWEITKGRGVKVAIFECGFEITHEELQNVAAYNLKTGGNSFEDIYFTKEYAHGTAVSSIIAAPQNSIGIIGVAPECDLLFVGDGTGELSDVDAIRGFEYAANWGARVINCSWGTYNISEIMENALKKYYDAGIVMVFSSGNDGVNFDVTDMEYGDINDESESPFVIGVGGSDTIGYHASLANYGANIDIMAPYYYILCADLMGYDEFNDKNNFADPNYIIVQGTSLSAPIVSGVIALMLAANPALGIEDIKKIIFETADKPIIDHAGGYNADGFSLKNANGKINAGRAVRRAAGIE